jgi:hypothetical protein
MHAFPTWYVNMGANRNQTSSSYNQRGQNGEFDGDRYDQHEEQETSASGSEQADWRDDSRLKADGTYGQMSRMRNTMCNSENTCDLGRLHSSSAVI